VSVDPGDRVDVMVQELDGKDGVLVVRMKADV